ncbi:MAG: glycerophosphodiester phosphodiesterase family protein [Acidobacteria bacterium]|nr:glycerophosphodiester phosphodiesterase family protein [Acidobacteriota bacterium]
MTRRLLALLLLTQVACAEQPAPPPAPAQSATATAVSPMAPSDVGAFFNCLRESGHTVVGAHRGGPVPGFAENAIETFAHTTGLAPALLEIDIARTRDNALVLMHDDTLDRTTTGSGPVRSRTLAEIQQLRLKDEAGTVLDARPPTLRQALDWAKDRAILELDVKRGVPYEDVLAEVRSAGALSRVVFITYSDDAAVRVHKLAPEMMLSVSMDEPRDISALERRGIDLTRVLAWTGTEAPNPSLNGALAARGIEAMFGTLGSPTSSWDGRFARDRRDRYAEFAKTGLQLIATDRPTEAARDLDANDGVSGIGAMRCR